eukprot:TRINITY_DN2487_c0_g2_i2.p1 TRINITY_DN2487_c0_g2~~TRINITY_DN2487_c0_g2_i2.p1  ORF type:complete len:267 (-),score=30.30 TRINITY_DN2487_c0_g2_i2:68-799(-)
MFDVMGGERRCMLDNLRQGDLITGSFEVNNRLNEAIHERLSSSSSRRAGGPSGYWGRMIYRTEDTIERLGRHLTMKMSIYDTEGNVIYTKAADSGGFAFTSIQEGQYSYCFFYEIEQGLGDQIYYSIIKNRPEIALRLSEIWRTVNLNIHLGKHNSITQDEMVRRSNLEPLELTLLRLEDDANRVWEELRAQSILNEARHDLLEGAGWKMNLLSAASYIVLGASVAWQLRYMRRYLKQKKVID